MYSAYDFLLFFCIIFVGFHNKIRYILLQHTLLDLIVGQRQASCEVSSRHHQLDTMDGRRRKRKKLTQVKLEIKKDWDRHPKPLSSISHQTLRGGVATSHQSIKYIGLPMTSKNERIAGEQVTTLLGSLMSSKP